MKVYVKTPSSSQQTFEFDHKLTAEEILNTIQESFPYPIYLCKVDNCYRALSHVIGHDCVLEFLDMRNQAAWLTYQKSLVLLYLKAVHDILGKEVKVTINNSLSKGLFTVVKAKYSSQNITEISDRMHQLVDLNLPIVKKHLTKDEAIALAKQLKQPETIQLLESIVSIDDIEIYSLEDETEIFYHQLVPSTGYLKLFELVEYKSGVLLRFPHQRNPLTVPEFESQPLLYDAFSESTRWGQLMGVNYVADLNNKILKENTKDLYLMQEALHEKRISDIADEIVSKKKRVVLICGPSSSGKTTFAKRLCIQLRVNGIKPLYLGTDDYFVDRVDTPLDENGEKDYENIECVDTRLFVDNLKDLLAGKEVDLPEYNFILGEKEFGKRITRIGSSQVIVIEGIHALNRLLTQGIDENEKYKIYISPLTAISVDQHNRIPTTDARLLRRMVRDNQFRNVDAAQTIHSWPKVRKGEDKNIFPFNGEADVFFNSNCIYELAVLKKYAEPLLKQIDRSVAEYAEAQRLLSFLKFIDEADDEKYILNNSVMREFIGGSIIVE